ncbi:MAG: hypothetical protein AABY22_34860 [Nanoarchaeota archaeon]
MNKTKRNLRDLLEYLAIAGSAFLVSCDDLINRDYSVDPVGVYESNETSEDDESEVESQVEVQPRQRYGRFRYPEEKETILYHSRRVGADEKLMLSIRESENGRAGRQFGVMPDSRYNRDRGYTNENGEFIEYPDDGELSKQAANAAWSIRRNRERYNALSEREKAEYEDFIDFMRRRYAPEKADNDPNNLNENWKRNVRARYRAHSEDE